MICSDVGSKGPGCGPSGTSGHHHRHGPDLRGQQQRRTASVWIRAADFESASARIGSGQWLEEVLKNERVPTCRDKHLCRQELIYEKPYTNTQGGLGQTTLQFPNG